MARREITDCRGVSFLPLRKPFGVVSLVPSWTETFFSLGLAQREILGRTRYCVHPRTQVVGVEEVGGPRDPDVARIIELDPDLIVADREENRQEDIAEMDGCWPVSRIFVSDPFSVSRALKHVEELGLLLGCETRARQLVLEVNSWLAKVKKDDRGKVAYLVWQDPFMAASRETYIGDVLATLGYQNVFHRRAKADLGLGGETRYPAVSIEVLAYLKPQTIFLSTEPFPFQRKHADHLRSRLSDLDPVFGESVDIRIVDGEYFAWYGSRMVPAFRHLLNLRRSARPCQLYAPRAYPGCRILCRCTRPTASCTASWNTTVLQEV